MRWFWIDRFVEFESGRSATSIKNVALAEEHLHDHFPGYPVMPNSLIVEGLAQTGGMLAAEYHDFKERVILAKISKMTFHGPALPGDQLTYRAEMDDISADGAVTSVTCHIGDRLQAEGQIFFAHVADQVTGKSLFEPGQMIHMMRLLKLYEVGRKPDGSAIMPPAEMT
jgi:3-hydroxyacyl-[acyl-carrier-protein] dehydratase